MKQHEPAPTPVDIPEGVRWDKNAPSEPPAPPPRGIPPHLERLVSFLKGVVADEALLVDLCLERTMDIVAWNIRSRMVGIDFMQGGENGQAGVLHPANVAALSIPLSIELYKQSLAALHDRREEFERLVTEANEELRRSSGGQSPPTILVPG